MTFPPQTPLLSFLSICRERPLAVGVSALVMTALVVGVCGMFASGDSFAIAYGGSEERLENGVGSDDADHSEEAEPADTDASVPETRAETEPDRPLTLYVHIGGEVAAPGVYGVLEGSRIADVVEIAGGFNVDADRNAVNLAREAVDGEQIIIPSIDDGVLPESYGSATGSVPGTAASSVPSGTGSIPGTSSLVNINTAGADELQTLSGIGASTAQKIVADREANGSFSDISDIQRVSGIGEKKYEAIKDFICI